LKRKKGKRKNFDANMVLVEQERGENTQLEKKRKTGVLFFAARKKKKTLFSPVIVIWRKELKHKGK